MGPVKALHIYAAPRGGGQGALTLLQQMLLVLNLHQGSLKRSQWEPSAEACPCTVLQASLWKQLARDKDVAAQTGARAAVPSRRQVLPGGRLRCPYMLFHM